MMVVPSKKRQPTLLAVDDNEVATMMVHNLEYLGCRTILAESGEKALGILESAPSVDLVITDLKDRNGRIGTYPSYKTARGAFGSPSHRLHRER